MPQIRRALRMVALVLGVVTAFGACAPIGSSPAAVRSSPVAAASPTAPPSASRPAASVKPTPTPKPTPKPKPTWQPDDISFSQISYNPNACFRTTFRDSEGHLVSGIKVELEFTAKNNGKVKSDYLWIRIDSTDWFATTPATLEKKWPTDREGFNPIGDKGMLVRGPQVLPGKSRDVAWSVVFVTPFDVHYRVQVYPGKADDPMLVLEGEPIAEWELWTTNRICF